MEGKKLYISAFVSNLLSLIVTLYVIISVHDAGGEREARAAIDMDVASLPLSGSRILQGNGEAQCCQCPDQILRAQQIMAILAEAVPMDKLAQKKAATWIIEEDPLQLPADAENLVQRYVLALFYISTAQIQPWLSCNRPSADDPGADCLFAVLQSLFPEPVYDEVPAVKWLGSENECTWAGAVCDEVGQVREISLPGQQIQSTLPTELALLPSLQSIFLPGNEFYGTLPPALAELTGLSSFEVQSNFFTGTVPLQWFDRLQMDDTFNLGTNFLTGTIPASVGKLSKLLGFFINDNMFTGTIPTQIASMADLLNTRWSRNLFSGKLPSQMGTMSLAEAWFHGNELTGALPAELGTGNLRFTCFDLRLHLNRFTGFIPESIYSMSLSRLDLYDNQLQGSISSSIGNMQFTLDTFRVRNNQLTGTVPTEMGQLFRLARLWLHGNKIRGSIPSELCALRGSIGLQELVADCLFCAEVSCPILGCCTTCCNSEIDVCSSA